MKAEKIYLPCDSKEVSDDEVLLRVEKWKNSFKSYVNYGYAKEKENVFVFSKDELKQLLIDFSFSSINDIDEFMKRKEI